MHAEEEGAGPWPLSKYFWGIGLVGAVCLAFLSSACSTFTQPLDPKLFYKRDIQIEVNGKGYEGVVTIPKASAYQITLRPKGKMDLVLVKSCHREDSAEKSNNGGFFIFKGKNEFQYKYKPRQGLEDRRTCPLTVDVYEAEKGRHSWAFLEFEHSDYALQFKVDCNGHTAVANGVYACQAKNGLVQRVSFPEPVMFWPVKPESCAKPEKKGNWFYEIALSTGECLYHFDTQSGVMGKLITIGYQGVLIRQEQ